ncbi:PDZ domain-containing GIPC3 [Brachionus plicatilis]|uniref:PDZ domain-containing GIPC3 n=1 Tax=Brachionus plicatilis TaxID=10195 RepID=A0A3M7QUJ2_BRAPC|nr:PDZ domain-containing GIPC3 [Brachionus plicatilis]
MPFVSKKKSKDEHTGLTESTMSKTSPEKKKPSDEPSKPKLVFHCQLAHGSPTGLISGFSNVKELYSKIAECYDIQANEILFCTLNTHKVDMNKLLGGQIGLEDFIFAHLKGSVKTIEVFKSEAALGLTITDNGAGYAFIKRIKEGSIIDKLSDQIRVGDHIEKINDQDLIGSRHFEVAKMLKDIPVGSTFTLKLVEPTREGFLNIGARNSKQVQKSVSNGKQTMRMKSGKVEERDEFVDLAVAKINSLLETFMGIHDSDLAQTIWELGRDYKNPHEFIEAISKSEICDFGFSEDFVFDLWGAISDARDGRLRALAQ